MNKKKAKSKKLTREKQYIKIKREKYKQVSLKVPVNVNIQTTSEKKGNKKMVAFVLSLIAVIAFIIAILSFWLQTKPVLAVSSITQSNISDPMDTYFSISNNSVLALMNVRLVFTTDIIAGNMVMKNVQTSGNEGQQDVGRINSGQKISQNTGIKIGNFSGNAQVEINVSYFPQYCPQFSFLEKHAKFRFNSIKTSDGYSWDRELFRDDRSYFALCK